MGGWGNKVSETPHHAWMIDLETLGKAPDCVIASIGAACCDLDASTFVLNYSFYILVDLHQPGRVIDPDTVLWWFKQSKKTIDETFLNSTPALLSGALMELEKALQTFPPDTLWSKGADFDLAILNHAYQQRDLITPWRYQQVRCFRTLGAYFSEVPEPPNPGAHNALYDAQTQLRHLWEINRVRKKLYSFGGTEKSSAQD